MYLFYGVLYVDFWVDCEFFRVPSWCPSAVGMEYSTNLVMVFSVNNGHMERLLFRMAFGSVVFVGLPMLRCKKLRVSLMVTSGRSALIRGSACCTDGGMFLAWGNLHSLYQTRTNAQGAAASILPVCLPSTKDSFMACRHHAINSSDFEIRISMPQISVMSTM